MWRMPAMPVLNRCKHVDQMFGLIPSYVVRWWSSWDTEEPVSKDREKKNSSKNKKEIYAKHNIHVYKNIYIHIPIYCL